MSNKTQLQTNNTTLDEYIARINSAKEVAASLPEAGSDDSTTYSTVYIRSDGPTSSIGVDGDIYICQTNGGAM